MTDKPNVIICFCDQLRAFEVGCYGSKSVKTPNIDAFAAQGVRFETACTNNPVCTPARSILLSGQYSRTCAGALGNCGEPEPERAVFPNTTIAEAFKAAGYRTGLIGKWHMRPHPRTVGFDSAFFPHHSHRYTGQTYFDSDGSSRVIEGFAHEAELDELSRFLAREPGKPFFLYYNISQPHMPLADMPERYLRMYSPDRVSLRPNVFIDGKPAYDANWFAIYLWDYLYYDKHLPYTAKLPKCFNIRHLTSLYYGSVTWVDDQLGELMRRLAAAGLDEHTIVVFTADHGDNLGSHHLFNKGRLYEESIRIPMIYRWPGGLTPPSSAPYKGGEAASPVYEGGAAASSPLTKVGRVPHPPLTKVGQVPHPPLTKGGQVPHPPLTKGGQGGVIHTQVTSLVDVMPTLLALAGVDVPDSVQGTDVSPVLRGEKQSVGENAAFIETTRGPVGIRTLTHLYGVDKATKNQRTTAVTDDRYKFFDILRDPMQEHNLATEPSAVADGLRERVLRWDRETPWLEAQ